MSTMIPEDAQSVIEHEILEQLQALMEEDFPDLVRHFLSDADTLIETMRAGIATHDVASVHRAAHSLKSSAASFGAMTLSGLARRLEAQGRAGDLSGVDALIAAMVEQLVRVRAVLESSIADDP